MRQKVANKELDGANGIMSEQVVIIRIGEMYSEIAHLRPPLEQSSFFYIGYVVGVIWYKGII